MTLPPEKEEEPISVKPDILESILKMQEAQGEAINRLVKDIDIMKAAIQIQPKTKGLDKVTAQGLALIIMVVIVGVSFFGSLMYYGIDTAIKVIATLNVFLTIIAVYFGLSFNLKNEKAQELVDQLQNALALTSK